MNLFLNFSMLCDAPKPWGLYFQDSATPQMEALIELHDNIMFYLTIILFGVAWIMASIIRNYINTKSPISNKYLNHGTLIELIWTITPALILILIAFPSFKLLYLMDEVTDPSLTIFVEGNSIMNVGPKSYILNKIETTYFLRPSTEKELNIITMYIFSTIGIKNNSYRLLNNNNNSFNYNMFKLFHTKVKSNFRIGPHNKEIISVIVGSLLGDSYANFRTIDGVRFCYRQSTKHQNYLFWLYNFFFLRGYCSNLEPRKFTIKLKDNLHYGYEFNTYTFNSLKWIHKMFYKKGVKYINPKIGEYITPLALAIWIMDDGGWTKPGVRISTYSFTYKEVELLCSILISKYDLECTIQHQKEINKYAIYIKGSEIEKLKTLVLPYFHESMHYKLGIK